MFQLMAEAFCHFIFSVNYHFLSIFIECLNRDLLRTDCFYKTVRETKASLNTFLHAALAYHLRIYKFESCVVKINDNQPFQNANLICFQCSSIFCFM